MRFVLVSYSEINKLYSTETDPQNPAISNKLALLALWLVDGIRFPINISVEWKQSRRIFIYYSEKKKWPVYNFVYCLFSNFWNLSVAMICIFSLAQYVDTSMCQKSLYLALIFDKKRSYKSI